MIFSDNIFKINSGSNATLYGINENVLNLYLFDKTLKLYKVLLNNDKNCVFLKEFNFDKIIQLNDNTICPCNKDFITIINENNL